MNEFAGYETDEEDSAPVEVPQDITDHATGLSRLLSERCATCILRSGDLMDLGPSHIAAVVRDALNRGSYIPCHDTLTYGNHPDFGPAICRGFFDAYADHSPALLILRMYHRLIEVSPPDRVPVKLESE